MFLNPKAFTPLSENNSSTFPRSQRINKGALSATLFPTMSRVPYTSGFTPFLCSFHFTRNLLATILSLAAWRHRCHLIINVWCHPCFLEVAARLSELRITDSMSSVLSQNKEKLEYWREFEQATPNFPECVLCIFYFLTLIASKKGF